MDFVAFLVYRRDVEAVRAYVKAHGVSSLNQPLEPDNETVLHKASAQGDAAMVKELISLGSMVDSISTVGLTPLHKASSAGEHAVLVTLLESGAEVDRQDKAGNTALHHAAQCGRSECVNTLLQAGAGAEMRNKLQLKPADICKAEVRNILEYHASATAPKTSAAAKVTPHVAIRVKMDPALSPDQVSPVKDATTIQPLKYMCGMKRNVPRRHIVGSLDSTDISGLVDDFRGLCMDKRVKRETFHIHQIDEGVEEQKNVDELKTDMPFPPKASRNTFRLRNHLTQILTVQRSAIKVRNQHLGRGAQADVYLGEFADFVVAVKAYKPPTAEDDSSKTAFEKEVAVLSALKHPNIILMFGHCMTEDDMLLVLEYCPHGDLSSFTRGKALHTKLDLLQQTCIGLAYLHKHLPPVVHGDLKPSNVLIGSDMRAKICDFGLSVIPAHTDLMRGASRYMSPERLDGAPADARSDMYGFGVCFWEIIEERICWENVPVLKTGSPSTKLDFINSAWASDASLQLLTEALLRDFPDARPTAEHTARELIALKPKGDKLLSPTNLFAFAKKNVTPTVA